MYLKSLTLRGFKSFASATTLTFEPGITCVVGPNGSGKSNVVDAIAWVMGEQGAKSLRGGKMEDVIFAGTSGRAPLGRAEVALTIDNSDGALPIDYSEVTITRTMFRNGGSEYAINGDTCRLLDVQELLSDSGIGREMHVIVGQGRLDAILHATPEERRGFIEEAAGVLKHRKRKEKALRKLDAMSANLVRLTDLTTELRRQLKPLGRQAELARRAQVIQADLRDAKLRLLADDVVAWSTQLAQEAADEAAVVARRDEVDAELVRLRAREADLEAELAANQPVAAQARTAHVALTGARERFAGLRSVAEEKRRGSAAVADAEVGPDPDELAAAAAQLRADDARLQQELAGLRSAAVAAREARIAAEKRLSSEEARLAAARRAAADRREGLARLRGQVAAAESKHETRVAEIARLEQSHTDALARVGEAQRAYADFQVVELGDDEPGGELQAAYDAAVSARHAADAELEQRRAVEADLARQEAATAATVDALTAGLQRKDAAARVLGIEGLAGVVGPVAAAVHVQHGYEGAVAAALGALADGVVVSDVDAAAAVLGTVAADDGRAHLLVAAHTPAVEEHPWPELPAGAVYAIDVVTAEPSQVRSALVRVLQRVVIVDDLTTAHHLVQRHDVVAVTRDGALLSRAAAAAGRAESLLEAQAAIDEAADALAAVRARRGRAADELASALAARDAAKAVEAEALGRLQEADAKRAAVAEQVGALGSAVTSSEAEADRLWKALEGARQAAAADAEHVAQLQARLAAATANAEQDSDTFGEDDVTAAKASAGEARTAEAEAQVAESTAAERHRAVVARAGELEESERSVRAARARVAEQRRRAQQAASVAADVLVALDVVEPLVVEAARTAEQAAADAEARRSAGEAALRTVRDAVRELDEEAAALRDSAHRDELAKAQQQMRIDAAQEKALTDFGVDPETLVAEYGPDVLIPASAIPVGDADEAVPEAEPLVFVRAEQEKRARAAERDLAALGRVNPLALEEFAALQERQAFLTEQLADLKSGRDDLLGIIADVDERVREVFAEAYADVAVQFAEVFGRLFPGGEGRLVLTDPDDMLTTGVEVEARPPGKKIKRLSLLSGGERSLTAVAFLVALFKARPSPFYLLDEVEAALDDVNLGRLLGILEELRATSQLLVITHQKRSMEIADALYGITMREGVTSVISQRLRETV